MKNFDGIIILGDIMLGRKCTKYVNNNGMDLIFSSVLSKYKNYAFVANLESPLVDTKESINDKKIRFKAPTNFAKLLKQQKIEALSLANNHTFDYGLDGFLSTTETLRANNVKFFGAGINHTSASAPCMFKIDDKKIGLIGFSYYPAASESSYGVNNLYGENIKKQIYELKKSTDFVIIMPHAGIELLDYPLPRDQKLYRSMIDAGADLVVGSHPHRVQVMEKWNNKRIYYSIGDFIFDHNHDDVWNNFWSNKAHPRVFNLKVDRKIPLESLLIVIEWNKKRKKFNVKHTPLLLGEDQEVIVLESQKKNVWELRFDEKNKDFLKQNLLHEKASSIQEKLGLK
ncbi:MAG: hypothetical protein CMG00_04440 [Candidatus Marinimicrobia bacterium]|nr:hypothetical protein [Candidatus Neomarinimicrobiota bacterium]